MATTVLAALILGLLCLRWRRGWTFQRSFGETRAAAGDDLRWAAPSAVVAALIGLLVATKGHPIAGVVIAALGWPVSFVLSLAHRTWVNARHPDKHEFWTKKKTMCFRHDEMWFLQIAIQPKYLLTGGHACSCCVTNPEGQIFRSRPGVPYVEYPRRGTGIEYFEKQPPPLTVGRYEIRWTEETGSGKENPLLSYVETVTEAALKEAATELE